MAKKYRHQSNILAIDCCEHILSALRGVAKFGLTVFYTKQHAKSDLPVTDVDLIVFGVSNLPVRRIFISRLRRFFPEVPLLILRRESVDEVEAKEQIRGEFILSDNRHLNDLTLVEEIRSILPLKLCQHTKLEYTDEFLRDVTRVIAEHYANPELSLDQVAREIPTSPTKLSRILNKQVGISFRQLLKHIRIEEAKRILASQRYSVKEVAARVGFSDSHYFSRSFKETTGYNATEFRHNPEDLIFN